jgi:hypothetical protein
MSESYFQVIHDDETRPGFGSANFPDGWASDFANRDLIQRGFPSKLSGPLPPAALTVGGFDDYLINDCLYTLCSEKLKSVIQAGQGPNDMVEWHPTVVHGNGETLPYYVLHLPVIRAVLDEQRSVFYSYHDFLVWDFKHRLGVEPPPDLPTRSVIKYAFNADALLDCHIFGREDGNWDWFVSNTLKRAIEAAGCTGMEFLQVEAYPQTPSERAL